MIDEKIMDELGFGDPVERSLVILLCHAILKELEAQDRLSATRWGVFNTMPIPGGEILNGNFPLGKMVGGIAIFCKNKEKQHGTVISIYAGPDEKLHVALLVAMRDGVKTDITNLSAIERHPATVVDYKDLTTTIDKLMAEFEESLK